MKISEATPREAGTGILTAEEVGELSCGLAFLAMHHREQIKDWRIRPKGDRRNKYVREWEDNQARIVKHHEDAIRDISRLSGKLGFRDWVAADEAKPSAHSLQSALSLSESPPTAP